MQDVQNKVNNQSNKDKIAYLSLIYKEVKETSNNQFLCRNDDNYIVILDSNLNERKDLGSAALISVFSESLDDYFNRKHLPMQFKELYSNSVRSGLITTAILTEDNKLIELADELHDDKCVEIQTLMYINSESSLGHALLWTKAGYRDKQYKLIDITTGKLIIKDTVKSWERYSDIVIYETINSEFIGVKLDSTFKNIVRIWDKTSEPSEDIKNDSDKLEIFKKEQLQEYINKIFREDTNPEPGEYINTKLKPSLRENFNNLREFYSESNKYGYCGITEKAYERNVIKYKNSRCIDKIIYRSKNPDEHLLYKDNLVYVFGRTRGVADTCILKLVNVQGETILDIDKLLENIRHKPEYQNRSIRFSGAESSNDSKYILLDGTTLNDELIYLGEKEFNSDGIVTNIKQIYLGLAGSFCTISDPVENTDKTLTDALKHTDMHRKRVIEFSVDDKQYIVDFDKNIYLIINRQLNEIEYVSNIKNLDIKRYETYRVDMPLNCEISILVANRIGKLAMSEFYDPPELKNKNRVYFA